MQRYSPAIYRYLLGAVRDTDTADELFQEFALRFLRGDFKRANPERGRFRDFLKTALYHLIVDHQKRQKNRPASLPPDGAEPAVAMPESTNTDEDFFTAWRADLMARPGKPWRYSNSRRDSPTTRCCAAAPTIQRCARRRLPGIWPRGWAGPSRRRGCASGCTWHARNLPIC